MAILRAEPHRSNEASSGKPELRQPEALLTVRPRARAGVQWLRLYLSSQSCFLSQRSASLKAGQIRSTSAQKRPEWLRWRRCASS